MLEGSWTRNADGLERGFSSCRAEPVILFLVELANALLNFWAAGAL
jgi:hypothetical protein